MPIEFQSGFIDLLRNWGITDFDQNKFQLGGALSPHRQRLVELVTTSSAFVDDALTALKIATFRNGSHANKPLHVLMTPPRPDYGLYHRDHNAWEAATLGEDRNPRLALEEWLGVANLITQLGGHVYVKPPVPNSVIGVSDGVFTANDGFLFPLRPDELLFQAARMIFPLRQGEAHHHQLFWESIL